MGAAMSSRKASAALQNSACPPRFQFHRTPGKKGRRGGIWLLVRPFPFHPLCRHHSQALQTRSDELFIETQAPTGSNIQRWHFVVVTDEQKRKTLGELYRQAMAMVYSHEAARMRQIVQSLEEAHTQERVMSSSQYLAEHMHEVPVLVVPCIQGRQEQASTVVQACSWGSILPAVWSFMLAARACSLGTA